MKINGIDHISINTIDINESIAFYDRYFGFKEETRADMGSLDLIYLRIDDKTMLELFDLRGATIDEVNAENNKGLRHLAFAVDDIEAWNKSLKEKGAIFTMELTTMEPIRSKGILIEDPNGVTIELVERY